MNFTNTRSSHRIMLFLLLLTAFVFQPLHLGAQEKAPQFRVIALAEHDGIHQPFVDAAKIWLGNLAKENNFTVDYIEDTEKINDAFLAAYKLFIQLNYPPYNWTDTAKAAFVKYIEEGKGGWIGFHHATLLGELTAFLSGHGSAILWAGSASRIMWRHLLPEP